MATIELTTLPIETTIADDDELVFTDKSESPDALNRITVGDFARSIGAGMALHFNDAYNQHVNHGYYWDRSAPSAGLFFYEAWVCAEDGAEYIISDGYGGGHNLLWGFSGFSGGYGPTAGNVQINGGPIGHASLDSVYAGDWHHIAISYDGLKLRPYIDGVPSKAISAVGLRQVTGDPSEGCMFVGGSDHSNFKGWIRQIRGFEGACPWNADQPFMPQHNFSAALNLSGNRAFGVSFLADYTGGTFPIPDLSSGYTNGIRQTITNTVVVTAVTAGDARCVVTAVGMTNSPKTVTFAVANSDTAADVATKARTALRADVDVAAFFSVGGASADIVLAVHNPADNDATMNVTIEDVTSGGITDDTTAVQTRAGVRGERLLHPGYPATELDPGRTGQFFGVLQVSGNITAQYQNLPEFQLVTFAKPSIYRGTPASIPGGAVGYDDFSRVNSTLAWDDVPSLGTNRTGQAWAAGAGMWGIIDSHAFAHNSAGVPAFAVFDLGKAAQDVTIQRGYTDADHTDLGMIVRYTDANNFVYCIASGSSFYLYEKVAGVDTAIGTPGVSAGAGWNYMRITAVGTTITLYANGSGTPLTSGTTALATGNKVGLYSYNVFTRIKSIVAY